MADAELSQQAVIRKTNHSISIYITIKTASLHTKQRHRYDEKRYAYATVCSYSDISVVQNRTSRDRTVIVVFTTHLD